MTHGPYDIVRHYRKPMTHGLYNVVQHRMVHGSWGISFPWVMGCTIYRGGILPMDHGLYDTILSKEFPMTHGPYNMTKSHGPWVIQHRTTKLGYRCPMTHGLYNSIECPWPMDCTTLLPSMTHGLYNTSASHCYDRERPRGCYDRERPRGCYDRERPRGDVTQTWAGTKDTTL